MRRFRASFSPLPAACAHPHTAMSTADAAQFNKKGSSANAKSFTEKLDSESLAFFNSVSSKPFADQAMAFLNAYWYEVSSEAEFIYTVSYDKMRYADMHFKGIQLVYSTYPSPQKTWSLGLCTPSSCASGPHLAHLKYCTNAGACC